jgi:hypothetical protein
MARTAQPARPREETDPRAPWFWRTRYQMLPVYTVALAVALGLSSWTLSEKQFYVALAAWVFFFGVLIRHRCYGGRRRDLQNAVFLWFLLLAFSAVVVTIRFSLLRWGNIAIGVMVLFTVFSLLWYLSKQNIRRVEIEKEIEAWPDIAARLGIPNVRKGVTKVTETGREIWLTWKPGDATIADVESRARLLESQFDIPVGQIKFIRKRNENGFVDPNCVKITENTGSKIHQETIEFTEPTMKRITDEMLVGMYEDGNMCKVKWYVKGWGGKHTITGGQTGSGKSSLYDLTFADSAYCQDVVRWGMDRKGGTALIPWASMFDWVATTEEACISMLAATKAVLEYRADYMAKKGWRTWRPSRRHPVLIVNLDEAAEILGLGTSGGMNASEYAASIARRARSCGVILLLAVQHLNLDAIGSTQITKNCARRFCFRVEDFAQQNSIISGSSGLFDATQINLPEQAGTFYWTDGGTPVLTAGRVRYVSPVKIREIVTKVGDNIADLDAGSAAAAAKGSAEFGDEAYEKRQRWLVEDLPPVDDGGDDEEEEDDEDELLPEDPDGLPDDADDLPEHPDSRIPTIPDGHPSGRGDGRDDPTVGQEWTDEEPDVPELPEDPPNVSMAELFASDDPEKLQAAITAFQAAHADRPITDDEAQQLLDAALDAAGPTGISPAELGEIVGRGRTWVSNRLADRRERGEIEGKGPMGPGRRYVRVKPGAGRSHLRVVPPMEGRSR